MESCFWRSTDLAEIQELRVSENLQVLDFEMLEASDSEILGAMLLTRLGLANWSEIGAYDAVEVLANADLSVVVVASLPAGGNADSPDAWDFSLLECSTYRDPGGLSVGAMIGVGAAVGTAALLVFLAANAKPKRSRR